MAAFAPPLRFCLLALLWLWRCAFAHAATLELNEAAGTRINLTPWWEVLQNMPREATIADVVGPQTAARFVAANPTIQGKQTDSVNFGMSSSAVWLRVTLHNTGSKDIERLLEVAFPQLDLVEFYTPTAQGFQKFVTGDSKPFAQRPLPHRYFVFPLRIEAGAQATYYLRVVSDSSLDIPATLWEPQTFNAESLKQYIGQALFFGMMASLGLYNLLLFISLRDRTYLYYVMHTATGTLSLLSYSGIGFQFLWPESPAWANVSSMIGFASNGLALLLFQRRLMATRTVVPALDRAMRGFMAVNVLQMVAFALLPFGAMVRIGIAIDALNMLLSAIVAIVCLRRGQRSARVFLLAFGCLMLTALLTALRSFGIAPTDFFTTSGLQLGTALEMLLFSLALADRFNQIRLEKDAAQQQLVENLMRSERVLEQHVAERTAELSRTNAELREHEKAPDQSMLHNALVNALASAAATPHQMLRFDGRKVLVAEDNEVNQQIAHEMLAAAGLQADIAGNGRIAVERLLAAGPGAYDLVLMDIQMPEMSGHAATRRIRAEPQFAQLPIVAMTSHASAEERDECLKSGMQDHIAKPIDPQQFYQMLARWLPQSATPASAPVANKTAQPAPHENPPIIIPGFETADTLKRLDDDLVLYRRVLEMMLPSLQETLDCYRMALKSHNRAAMKNAAHSVRGMASNAGAVQLAGAARELERAIVQGSETEEQAVGFCAQMEETIRLVAQGLAEWKLKGVA
ncbi:MAG TPA: 7TM diverse intracellular signaling domain-containing protein [Noviherbaspirillum sp.]